MFFNKKDPPAPKTGSRQHLSALVREHMGDADDDSVRIVTAVAGLLACVAYADRDYSDAERAHIRSELGRLHGLAAGGAAAIAALLDAHILQVAVGNQQAYTRDLRELTDVEMRREVLDVLVDLAAADGEVSMEETDFMRRTTSALGMDQADYIASQARHRDRLSVLK